MKYAVLSLICGGFFITSLPAHADIQSLNNNFSNFHISLPSAESGNINLNDTNRAIAGTIKEPDIQPSPGFNPSLIEQNGMEEISYSDAVRIAKAKQIYELAIEESDPPEAFMKTIDGREFKFYAPNILLDPIFLNSGASISIEPPSDILISWGQRLMIVVQVAMLFLLSGLIVFFVRKFIKNPATQYNSKKSDRITFVDVAGHENAKIELQEIITYLKDFKGMKRLGGRVPKGALMIGPPGNGKTMLAKATAYEAGVPFLSLNGSSFQEMFAGLGAARMRKLKMAAKRLARRKGGCIVFIDEIDGVGLDRGGNAGGDVKEDRNQTLNELLDMLDGLEKLDGVFVLGATNRPDAIDKALLRPKRLERTIDVPMPHRRDREECIRKTILRLKMPIDANVDIERAAQITTGMSYADCEGMLNEAAIKAAREKATCITMQHIIYGRDRLRMGIARSGVILNSEERKIVAYHEGGHAVMSLECPHSDPIERATILPHGRSLGHVMKVPEEERYMNTYAYLRDIVKVMLAGREAERLIFGSEHVTDGATQDFREATRLVRRMICNAGMDEKIGSISIEPDETGHIPDAVNMMVFERTKEILDKMSHEVREILSSKQAGLKAIAEALLQNDMLDGARISSIYRAATDTTSSQITDIVAA